MERYNPFNIPNLVSVSRIFFALAALRYRYLEMNIMAYFIYCLAWATDPLDGWLAEKLGCQHKYGMFVDKGCDMAAITATMAGLFYLDELPRHMIFSLFFLLLWIPRWVLWIYKPKSEGKKITEFVQMVYFLYLVASLCAYYAEMAFSGDRLIFILILTATFCLIVVIIKIPRLKKIFH
jgi:phosphatidylglycerophosphate synthase